MITWGVEIRPNYPKVDEVTEIIRESILKEGDSISGDSTDWKIHSSLEEMRKKITREKFQTEFNRGVGETLAYAGPAIAASGILTLRPELTALGSSFFALGLIVREAGNKNKPRIDERIKTFNETFPDQKPVTFSPREYLAYTYPVLNRLPFFRR